MRSLLQLQRDRGLIKNKFHSLGRLHAEVLRIGEKDELDLLNSNMRGKNGISIIVSSYRAGMYENAQCTMHSAKLLV